MKVTLSSEKKKELELMHDSTRDGRVRDRIKAVLLASEGWSSVMIHGKIMNIPGNKGSPEPRKNHEHPRQ